MERDPTWTTQYLIDYVADFAKVPADGLEVMWDNGTNVLLIDATHEYSVQFAYGSTQPVVIYQEFAPDVINYKRENGYYEKDDDDATQED